ncbi:MAG: sugar phosphate isomerase/epimerase [Clostridia bacterium]|nr:sugar phosphate isomerase/epimerase [Clostridia bacterium]
MEFSLNAEYLKRTRDPRVRRTPSECLQICHAAGFRTVSYFPDFASDAWEEEVNAVVQASDVWGMSLDQVHAPYNFYAHQPLAVFHERLRRSIVAAKRMNASYLVFHADEYHPLPGEAYDAEIALRTVYEIFAPHIENALRMGVTPVFENTFEDHHRVSVRERSHFCAELSELIAVMDRFADPRIGCCWDFGHGKLAMETDERHADAIRTMGKRIVCTHIHDNYYKKDLHLPPFMGEANWELLMKAVKEIGYGGNLTFELGYSTMEESLVADFMKNLYRTAGILKEMMDG